jgi:hypothetical protein
MGENKAEGGVGEKKAETGERATAGNDGGWLQPGATLAPGAAGGITVVLANALVATFGVPPAYSALAISCLFAVLIVYTFSVAWVLRVVYFVLNALFIFATAMGFNGAGTQAGRALEPTPAHVAEQARPASQPFFSNWLDGTVRDRNNLLTEVSQLDKAVASKTLVDLGVPPDKTEAPDKALEKVVASSRTASEVRHLKQLITNAKVALEKK